MAPRPVCEGFSPHRWRRVSLARFFRRQQHYGLGWFNLATRY